MTFDLTAHIEAMTRIVRDTERDGKAAVAVIASRVYETDTADLWNALTTAERLKRWFAPVSGDLRNGGRYHVENNASGTITECERNRRIAATWEFAGDVSWITITLSPEGEGTRLELEHVAIASPHYDKYGPGAVGVGWDLGFMGLARHLAEPLAEHPAEAAEGWFASQEAKDMIRLTSTAWGAADIDGHDDGDREVALARAERTRQFFSGESAPAEM